MAARVRLDAPAPKKRGQERGLYDPVEAGVRFFHSGSTLQDLVLGGGWVEGRMINIVGDKSTGKTLQAIEAAANFLRKYPNGRVHYVEVEAAFDVGYARSMGLPKNRVKLHEDMGTVEDVFRHLNKLVDRTSPECEPILYIVDSLDALSDESEMATKVGQGTYGTGKPKMLSRLFRQLVRRLQTSNVTVMIISQVRDEIGGMSFGRSQKRSGGKAMDFYASQVIWLTHLKRLDRTVKGVKRVYGVRVMAACEKNKVSMPFRKCTYPIHFGFGVEDVVSCMEWIIETKSHREIGITSEKAAKSVLSSISKMSDKDYYDLHKRLKKVVPKIWRDIEVSFAPTRRKYAV